MHGKGAFVLWLWGVSRGVSFCRRLLHYREFKFGLALGVAPGKKLVSYLQCGECSVFHGSS